MIDYHVLSENGDGENSLPVIMITVSVNRANVILCRTGGPCPLFRMMAHCDEAKRECVTLPRGVANACALILMNCFYCFTRCNKEGKRDASAFKPILTFRVGSLYS